MDRFVLTDAQWAKMESLCLGKRGDPGRSGQDIPVQSALTTLGLASLDWVTQDLVITEDGLVGPRKRLP
jgi:hypothetical protein